MKVLYESRQLHNGSVSTLPIKKGKVKEPCARSLRGKKEQGRQSTSRRTCTEEEIRESMPNDFSVKQSIKQRDTRGFGCGVFGLTASFVAAKQDCENPTCHMAHVYASEAAEIKTGNLFIMPFTLGLMRVNTNVLQLTAMFVLTGVDAPERTSVRLHACLKVVP